MRILQLTTRIALSAIISIAITSTCYSQLTLSWIDPSGGFWQDPANWSTGFLPTDQDIALFDLPDSYVVSWNGVTGDREVDQLHVFGGNVTFQNQTNTQHELGVGINTMNDSVSVRLGGVLQLNGLKLSSVGVVDAGMEGFLRINGDHPAGTSLEADFLQTFDNGIFQMNGGAQANILRDTFINSDPISLGFCNEISGDGTHLQTDRIFVDDSQTAWLELEGGAMITAATLSAIGNTSSGVMVVSDEGTVFNSAELDVGFQSQGILRVLDGGKVFATGIASIGKLNSSLGQVCVDGNGSELVVMEQAGLSSLSIGKFGTGELVIENQGRAQANDVFVIGEATVRGQDSQLQADTLIVESDQFGKLFIDDDARVDVAGTATVDFLTEISMGGTATPQITANQIVNNGLLNMHADIGPDVFGDVENNNLIQTADNVDTWFHDSFQHNGVAVETGAGGRTRFLGTTSGAGPYTGPGEVEFVTVVRPGAGDGVGVAGIIDIEGVLDLGPNANLHIELGGVVIDQNDRIFVDGDALIDGDITVSLINGFQPSDGDNFPIIVIGGTRSGLFNFLAEGDTVATFGNIDLNITYAFLGGNDIALVAVENPFIPGDVNGDGEVNLLDVQPFIDLVASGGYLASADINEDGVVNLLDVSPFIELLAG